MKAFVCFLMLMFWNVMADMAGECSMVAFYQELGCKPTPNSDNSTLCPASYTCPELHPDPTKCYHKGMAYESKSTIPQNLIENPCMQRCSCQNSGAPQFQCAVVDCVEEVFKDKDLKEQCIYTKELGECCSTGKVCGKDAIANLKTCQVDGLTYREGEAFYPKGTFKTCICTADWDGSTDKSYCRDVNCGIEIVYQDDLMNNCAPVFTKRDNGVASCPIGFQCASANSQVIQHSNGSGECRFGNLTLSVGDEVTVDTKCHKCSCDVPPFVSCLLNQDC